MAIPAFVIPSRIALTKANRKKTLFARNADMRITVATFAAFNVPRNLKHVNQKSNMDLKEALEHLNHHVEWMNGEQVGNPVSRYNLRFSIECVLQWHKDNEMKNCETCKFQHLDFLDPNCDGCNHNSINSSNWQPKEPIEAVSEPQNLQSQIKLSEPITIEAGSTWSTINTKSN